MIDILIIYDVEGWAYHSRARALHTYAPQDTRVRLAEFNRLSGTHEEQRTQLNQVLGTKAPDLILLLCQKEARYLSQALEQRNWPTLLVVSWNSGWPRLEDEYWALFAVADHVIVNNFDYWENSGMPERSTAISNGVDGEIFHITQIPETRRPRVLWCGSKCHRTLKGYDELMVPLAERLRGDGIDCDLQLTNSYSPEKRSQVQMADWYNSGTVLVCASESEGTPNTALEAAACGCTIVSTPVGNMLELIRDDENGYLVERELDSLYQGVQRALANYPRLSNQLQQDIAGWHWHRRSTDYFSLFHKLVTNGADQRPDFTQQLTVFVSTIGASSFVDCMARLHAQDCYFRLEVINRVAPMSAAFQHMMDRCETPFYIQVDEDMLLYPHAVHALYQRITRSAEDVALVAGWLWDDHLDRCIIGVKAFRHEIVRNYPFRNVLSSEKDQIQKLLDDGFRYDILPDHDLRREGEFTMGLHGTHYNEHSAFERYATLERKRCQHPENLAWFDQQGHTLLQRFRDQPTALDLMALMGILAGRVHDDGQGGEKDYTSYHDMPGLEEARAFLAACLPNADQ
jgi:hypothetical protein